MEIRTRDEALGQIAGLIRQFQIDLSELKSLYATQQSDKKSSILPTALSYLGGLFILSGIGIYIGLKWAVMNSAARILITLGTGTVALILGALSHKDPRYQKAVAPLLVLAAFLQTGGLLVTMAEFSRNTHDVELAFLIASGTIFLVQCLLFSAIRRTSVVFLMMAFGYAFFGTFAHRIGIPGNWLAMVMGLSITAIGFHLQSTAHRGLCAFFNFIGSLLFLTGIYDIVNGTSIEILFIGACAGVIYLSTVIRSGTLLFNASVGLLAYLSYFSAKHFAGSIGWPITLIAIGLMMLGIASTAWKIRNKYIKGAV